VCQDEPCGECTTDEDCDTGICQEGYTDVGNGCCEPGTTYNPDGDFCERDNEPGVGTMPGSYYPGYCCDGECQEEPCDPCQPCDDCSWPASRNEGVECFITPCCYFPYSNVNSRDQTFSSTLPPGISWKTGYPDALDLCNWRWCADSVNAQCYDSNANACRVITKTRYKLLALDCDTESAVDLTSTAATGTFETTSSGACTSGPDFPSYFDDPVPVCPP
jgi:hypothetical protein